MRSILRETNRLLRAINLLRLTLQRCQWADTSRVYATRTVAVRKRFAQALRFLESHTLTGKARVAQFEAVQAAQVGGRQAVHAVSDRAEAAHHARVPRFQVACGVQKGLKVACVLAPRLLHPNGNIESNNGVVP